MYMTNEMPKHLGHYQRKIFEFLKEEKNQDGASIKEIIKMLYNKDASRGSVEYHSTYQSLINLQKRGYLERIPPVPAKFRIKKTK